MRAITPGKLILTAVGAFTAVSPWVFDYGETHLFNPRWPPHAKFHNAQTLLMGVALGLATVAYAWRGPAGERGVVTAALFASLYWLTQAGAVFLPNTALTDPEFADRVPHPFGLGGPQPVLDAVVLALVGLACLLERRATAAVAHDAGGRAE